MKTNRYTFFLCILFIMLSQSVGYKAPIIILKWLTFVLIIILECKTFYLNNKQGELVPSRNIFLRIIFILFLGIISIPISDISKTKSNAVVCPYTELHPSEYYKQAGIANKFDANNYFKNLKEASSFCEVEIDSIPYQNNFYKLSTIKYLPKGYNKKILIIASVHGDEPAGALSIPEILREIKQNENKYKNTAICILSPMNPIGLTFASRENECGCNINRDYENPSQKETKHIVNTIKTFKPDLILDLHENNCNWKTCLMANTIASNEFGKLLTENLTENKIDLANNAFDLNLEIKGWHKRTKYRKIINKMAGMHDLMWFGQTINIPVITAECEQSLTIEKRIFICKKTFEAVVENINALAISLDE